MAAASVKPPLDAEPEVAAAELLAPKATPESRRASWLRRNGLQVLVHVGALLPLATLIWGVAHDQFYNSVQSITSRTGWSALVLLLLALACTPASAVYGFKQATLARRPLGLYAFFYAGLHLLNWSVFDEHLDWAGFVQTMLDRNAILIGVAALVLMIPLALTSTKGWQRRLGRRWKLLHRLVYAIAGLSVLHLYLVGTTRAGEPLRYGVILAALLALRLPPIRRALWSFLH